MESINFIILRFLAERNDSLNYYQLSRKLKNKRLHSEVKNLERIMEELLQKGLIVIDNNKISDSNFYKISNKGTQLISQMN